MQEYVIELIIVRLLLFVNLLHRMQSLNAQFLLTTWTCTKLTFLLCGNGSGETIAALHSKS